MDQQPDLNEHQELRELLREVMKTQELILRRIEQLELQLGPGAGS